MAELGVPLLANSTGGILMPKTPAEHMRNSADVQESRDIEYGSAYKRHGPAIAPLFPDGVILSTPADHTRFAILTLLFGKLTRYCGNFERGGHEDSLTDMIAYTAMLKEVDEEEREAQALRFAGKMIVDGAVTADSIVESHSPQGVFGLTEEAMDKLGK